MAAGSPRNRRGPSRARISSAGFLFAVDDANAVGSGRSVPGVSIHAILSEIRDASWNSGDTRRRAGGRFRTAEFEAFGDAAREIFRRIGFRRRTGRRCSHLDGELSFAQVGEEFFAELERFEPFGEANPRPLFLARRVASRPGLRRVGERGCRGILASGGREIRAIAWNLSERWERLAAAEMDVAFHIQRNERYGNVELEIVDVREPEA